MSKIAVLFPSNQYCAWSMGRGIPETLKRMGHEVLPIVMPTSRQASQQLLIHTRATSPKVEEIKKCDAAIVSGPEHVIPWIDAVYSMYEWNNLGIPRAAWVHESMRREDQNIDFDAIKTVADQWFFPGIQDAEMHDQEPFAKGRSYWLPLGVDTEIFKPRSRMIMTPSKGTINTDHVTGVLTPRFVDNIHEFDIAFVGLLYPKRQVFMQAVARHDHPPIRIGGCSIQDIRGFDERGTAERLAENYRAIKVFFNMPALSGMLVSKIYEVMACGTFLLTPELPKDFGVSQNMKLFQHGIHLVYYSPSNTPYIAQLLRESISEEYAEKRQAIAERGCHEVHEKHSLKLRMEQMLAMAGIGEHAKVAVD